MINYFQLQYKIINRSFIEFGLPVFIGYTLILCGFFIGSEKLFEKLDYAKLIYVVIYIGFVLQLSNLDRNQFLKSCFNRNDYLKIRLIENYIIALPFIIYLFYKQLFLDVIWLVFIATLLSFIKFSDVLQKTIPTPFSKKPFEFTIGFRKTFYIFILLFFILFKAIEVSNLNLGIFSIVACFAIIFSYYSSPENAYYVWNFSLAPKDFLWTKIKILIKYATYLVFPLVAILSFIYFKEFESILIFTFLGYLFIITGVLAKYSAYPEKINVVQGVFLAFCLYFPPLLAVVIPIFYLQAIKNLKRILK